MNETSTKGVTTTIVAVVIVVLVIAVAIGVGSYIITAPHPIYCCTTTTSNSSTTSSQQAATSSSSTLSPTNQLYQVEFLQESNCPYGVWLVPWAVVLDNQTIVQPSNATLPLSFANTHFISADNYSTIWFSVTNGTYSYTILPNDPLGSAQSGNITVDGRPVVVQVYAFGEAMGCTTTRTTVSG